MTKPTPQAQWEQCLSILKVNIDRQAYDALLANISFVSLNKEENKIYLRVQSSFIYETIEHTKRIRQLLYSVIWSVYKTKLIIRYQILADSTTNTVTNVEGTPGTTVETKINRRTKKVEEVVESELESRLNENYTFDNFIEGNGNKLLRSVGISIADNPKQTTFNPLFVYGGSGVGKTHLVTAIGIQFKRNFPQKRVLYVTAHDFKVQFMTAKQQNRINDFIYFYQTIDVLIIDDVQEFSGLTGTQQTFFHIFNHLKMNGKQIIMTSDQAPGSMPGMEERLITRFKWGLATELERPDQELCHKILENKIKQDDLQISDEVVDFISRNIVNSIRDLEGIICSLQAHAMALNRDIDLSIAQLVINQSVKAQKKSITIEMIMDAVCSYFSVSQEDVMSKTRKANIVLVRQVAMYLAAKTTKMSTSKIGLYIGGRNHATVLHSIKQVQNRLLTDKNFQQQVEEIEQSLR